MSFTNMLIRRNADFSIPQEIDALLFGNGRKQSARYAGGLRVSQNAEGGGISNNSNIISEGICVSGFSQMGGNFSDAAGNWKNL